MRTKKQIEQEADKTLNSFDGLHRAAPQPYLFTRVKARLMRKEKNAWSTAFSFLSRPTVAFAMILIALFVNAFLFFEFRAEPVQASGEGAQMFANEYNLTDNTIYDSTVEPE